MTPNKSTRVGGSRLAIWAAATLTALPVNSRLGRIRHPSPSQQPLPPPPPPPPQGRSCAVYLGRRRSSAVSQQSAAGGFGDKQKRDADGFCGSTLGLNHRCDSFPGSALFRSVLSRQYGRRAFTQCKQGGTAATSLMRASLIESGWARKWPFAPADDHLHLYYKTAC